MHRETKEVDLWEQLVGRLSVKVAKNQKILYLRQTKSTNSSKNKKKIM